jgi:asparagine synthase (glutamine-hydrolysing)
MCGIAGIIYFNNTKVEERLIRGMTDCMAHRGPDSDGLLVEGSLALGQRRLSIIDLSAASDQPFIDNSGRYKMVFNGEIYNYAHVKSLIKNYEFKTTGDTEVVIAAYAAWGAKCLDHFRGMFAFAIWDEQEKELFIARDKMGVKPLYYFLDEEKLLFASESRAILGTGLVKKKISEAALLDYFSYQSVPYPLSMIEGILQLEAGGWIKIRKGKTEKKLYWDLTDRPVDFDFGETGRLHKKIHDLLLQSVARRLVSDVPVGAFLSGGIDSSAVVGLMAEASAARPNTFNIFFQEKEYDESAYADRIAAKFNTQHTRILLKPTSFLDELPHALNGMDTPSGDGINTYVVSKAIRAKGIKVALSGVGGDELFAGYPYFNQFMRMQSNSWIWKLPPSIRRLAAFSASGAKRQRLRQLLLADSCSIDNAYPVFRQILGPSLLRELTHLETAAGTEPGNTAIRHILRDKRQTLEKLPLFSQVSAAEYLGYTQHTLLKDTDQMGMAVSLEIREPFFDQDLVEFVLAIPDTLKRPTYPKSLLVESLKPMLPDEIVFRKKQGFLFPWKDWLKHELRSFCEIRITNMADRSFVNGQALISYWRRFLAGDKDIRWAEIWLFVVLEYWLEKNGVS